MKKLFTYLKKSTAKFLFTILVLLNSTIGIAQTTLNTTAVSGFLNNNGSGTVTFNFQNTNGFDIIITDIEGIVGTAGLTTAEIWIKTTPVNGAPGAISAANGWILAASGTFTGILNTTTLVTQPMLTGLNVIIPTGVTYGMAITAYTTAGTQRYHSMVAPNVPLTTVSGGGCNILMGDNISFAGGFPPAAPTFTPRGWLGKLTFIPGVPCVDPPVPGSSTATPNSNVCPGANVNLNLSGVVFGTGQTYQWESSSSIGGPYTPVSGVQSSPAFTVNPLVDTWYRCAVTCGSTTLYSTPVEVTVQTGFAGIFTIDNTLPTGGSNFESFTDAVNAMNNCGITGPVIFNVSAGQTFNENVPIITVNSNSVNTVTFQRSGAGPNPVIVPTGSTLTTDAGITINGSDFITFDGIDITASGAAVENGYRIQAVSATNGAQNNTIKNCQITLNRTNLNSRGIFQTNNAFTPTSVDGTNSHNTYMNIEIYNVYAGVQLTGASTATFPDRNNKIITDNCSTMNIIGDPLTPFDIGGGFSATQTWGIRLTNQAGFTVSNNRISNVSSNTTTDGIFIETYIGFAGFLASSLNNNVIIGVRNNLATSTTQVSGIRLSHTTLTVPLGTKLFVYNNSVSNITSAYTGAASTPSTAAGIKGLIISGTGGSIVNQTYEIYNNSISIDGSGSPNNSNACFQITATTNTGPINIVRNNVFANFTIAQTGVARHLGLFTASIGGATALGPAGSAFTNNDIWIANDANVTGFTARGSTTQYNGIAAFQAAYTQATANIEVNPMFFSNNSNLHATNLALDGSGAAYPGYLTIDLDCAPRSAPADIGAYNVAPCAGTPPTASITGSLCNGGALTAVTNASSPNYQWLLNGNPVGSNSSTLITNEAGSYSVSIWESGTLCISTSSAVTVTPGVSINPTASPTLICDGESSQLSANGAVSGVFSYGVTNLVGQSYTTLTGPGITVINDASQLTPGFSSANQDDGGVLVSLPFAFNYFGNSFTQASFSTNGWVSMGATYSTIAAGPDRTPGNLFITTAPNNTLAPWFKDMGANFGAGFPGTMRHGLIGTDVYAFQWDQAVGTGFSNTTTILVSFQVNIYGPGSSNPGRIEYIYGPTLGAIAFAAAVGIEDAVGGTGHFLNALNGSTSSTLLSSAWPGNGNGFAFEPFSLNYSWSPAGTLNNSTIANPLATPPIGTTVYTVTATNSFGCTASGTVSITNLGPANPPPGASGTTSCAGESVILSATGIGTIKWYNALSGGTLLHTGASFTVSPTLTTTYYVADDNGTCESDRVAVTVTVNPVPIVNPTSAPSTICDGSSSQLSANAFPFPGISYNLSGLTGQTYSQLTGTGITVINSTAQLTAGMGSGGQDDGGVVITLPFTFSYMGNTFTQMSMCTNGWVGAGNHGTIDAVNMRLAGNLFTSTIPNNTLAAWFKDMGANFGVGFPGSMRHGLIGPDKYAFQWDQAVGSGFSNTTTILISFQVNIYGPASSSPGRIEFIYGPTLGAIAFAASIGIEDGIGGANHYINALNGSSTSTALSTAWPGNGNGFAFDPVSPSVLWSPAGSLNDPTLPNPIASPSGVGTTIYTVTATNSFGCTATGTTSVTVIPSPPAPTATALNTVCGVGDVTLSATGTGNPGTVIRWYDVPAGGTPIGTGNSIIVTINTTTTFYATEYDGTQCEGPRTAVNAVSTPAPAITLTSTLAAICDGSSTPAVLTTTSPNDPNYSYAYTPTTGLSPANGLGSSVAALPGTSTTYTVTATDGNSGCVNTATIFLGVGTTPVFTSVTASPSSLCTGESSTLNASANITGGTIDPEPTGYCNPLSFTSPGATGDFISNVSLNTLNNSTGDGPGDYNYYPPTGTQTTTVIAGNTYTLTVTTDPGFGQGKAVFIDWNRNGIFEASEMVLATASSTLPASAQVTVPLSASSGMTRMRVVCVFANTAASTWACEPTSFGFGEVEDYTITVEGGGSSGIIYTWSPAGTLNTPTGQTVIATPLTGGTYIYTVTGSHEGCFATATVTVNANQTPPAPIAIYGTRCGPGQVNLGATGTGGTLIWTEMEAGSIVNTGTSYSPVVSSNGSFHVLEYPVLNPAQNIGLNGTGSAPVGYFPSNAQWVLFNVTDDKGIIINSVDIFANTPAGTPYTIALQDLSNNTYSTVSGVTTFQNTAGQAPINPQTVALNFFVPQGSWKLTPIINPNLAVHQGGAVSIPYTIPGVISLIGYSTTTTPLANTFGLFYNWNISTACFSPQTIVNYTLTTPPPLTITPGGSTSYCGTGSVSLTAGGDPSWTTFSWAPANGLSSTSGATVNASPTQTTTYTVYAQDNNGINGCANTASITITSNPPPTVQVLPIIDPQCINSTVQFTATGSSESYKRIGMTESNAFVSGGIFNGANFAQRSQMIITAAELNAAGLLGPGFISGIGFKVVQKLSSQPYTNFTINIANTALNAFASTTYLTPGATVYQNDYSTVAGWNDLEFDTPYFWDGLSNLLIQTCFTNATTTFFDMVYTSDAGANRFNSINAAACGAASGTLAVNRPNVRFTGGIVNFSWNPATDLSATNISNPVYTASSLGLKTYTVTVSDPASSCTATASLSFTVSDTPTTPVATITGESEFCQSGSTTIVMTGSTGSIQWESSPDGTTWNIIPGANSGTYNTGIINQTTHYRVVTSCGNSATSSAVTVIVNNPQILTSVGDSRCGHGEVSLSATSSPGSTIVWYPTLTGGSVLENGPVFNPFVTSDTTFYVAAQIGGGGQETAPMPAQITTFVGNVRGYWFTSPVDFTITGLKVPGATVNQSIAVVRFNPAVPPPVFAATTNAFNTLYLTQNNPNTGVIPVSITINAGDVIGILGQWQTTTSYGPTGTFTSSISGQPVTLTRMGMQFPLTTTPPQDLWTEPGGNLGLIEMTYSVGCEGPRVPVQVIVTPAPTVTITPSSSTIMCGGNPFTLTASSSNDPNYQYTWSPGGMTSATIIVSPYETTTYTVSATDGICNADPVSYTITVLPTPAVPVLSSSNSQICEGDMITITVTNPSNQIITGSGLVTVGVQGTTIQGGSPYRAGGGAAMRTQYIYTAAELTAAGLSAGNALSSIAFNLTTLSAGTLPGYTIRLGHTVASAVTATFLLDPTTVVFGPTNINMDLVPLGYTTWSFSNNFTWDGVSNLLIEVCHDNPSPTGGSGFVAAIAGAGLHSQAINAAGCTALSGTIGTGKPVIQLGFTGVSVPATYTWQPGNLTGTSVMVNPSVTTTYTVTGSFMNGCTSTADIFIDVEPIPTPVISSSIVNPVCQGQLAVLSSQYSSINGYQFNWNSGLAATETIDASIPGDYTLIVTSSNGCTSNLITYTVEYATVFVDLPITTDVLCNGDSTGTATINALGTLYDPSGNLTFGPFAYSANGGAFQGSSTLTGLWAGSHNIAVYDSASGCTANVVAIVSEPPPLIAGPVVINQNVSCNGLSDGSATVSASGGVGPYIFNWNTPIPKQGEIHNEIPAGTWTITITDFNGCTATTTVTITEPDELIVSIDSQSEVSCYGLSDGSVTISATGGTLPYIGTGSFTGLAAGVHEFIVIDANGCADTIDVTITEPIEVTISATSTNVSCFGLADGTISATASLGASITVNGLPYNPGDTYGPGIYSVVATAPDGNNIGVCTASMSVSITEPIEVTISASHTNVTCNGFANGTISAVASLGASITINGQPYNPSAQYGPGTYTVMATAPDGNNAGVCTATTTVTITEPPVLSVTINSTNSTYWSANNGTATAVPSGGTPLYSYLWNTGSTAASINGLAPASYTVTVTDAKGCVTSATVIITEPPFICSGSSTHTKWGPGGWGGTPNGSNPATYLYANFAAAFPNGLTIGHPLNTGCNRSMKWTTPQAITAFLPSTGTPRRLDAGHKTNFTAAQYGNTLAAQVTALTINVVFDAYDPNFSPNSTVPFGSMIVCISGNNTQFNGWTVNQLLAEGNTVLACGASKGYTSALNDAIDKVNNQSNATCCPTAPVVKIINPEPVAMEDELKLNVYPNPTSGKITVQFESKNETATDIIVMDMRGRVVINLNNEEGSNFMRQIDLSMFENGLYILSIYNSGQFLKSAKVMKTE